MIDLHLHTRYSDGKNTVFEILDKAEEMGIEVLSITDHDSVDTYLNYSKEEISNHYKGKIIVGCEFTVQINGQRLEILGYNFDVNIVNKFLKEYYPENFWSSKIEIFQNRLLENLRKSDLKYDEKSIIEQFDGTYKLESIVYNELIKYKENYEILGEDTLSRKSIFFRRCCSNPDSVLFMNYAEFRPYIDDVIELIHKAGGLAFYAHPFNKYQVKDEKGLLEEVYKHDIDGVECYYSGFDDEQIKYIEEFARTHNLLISGGSDCHDINGEIKLGVGKGNLNVDKKILDNWNIM
jgi:hypothetical protein